MVVGTSLLKFDGTSYFSPSFPRGGLGAIFTTVVTHLEGTPTFTVTVEHRHQSDTTWTTLGAFTDITTTGAVTVDLTSVKEIVRFKYDFGAGDASTDAVHFSMQAPSWRPYA